MNKIKSIYAHEILDSRGNPTLEVEVILENGITGKAAVPSGASVGAYEALELRDKDPKRYNGKGVLAACRNVNTEIVQKLKKADVTVQRKIDKMLIALDGTTNKSRLGANAILGVSLACARAAARTQNLKLYEWIARLFQAKTLELPNPMMNILNGGKHAPGGLDIQEFMIVPKVNKFSEKVRCGAEIFHTLKDILKQEGYALGVGDEGGFAPKLESNKSALEMIIQAIKKAGYEPKRDVDLALDCAASEFYNKEENKYILASEKATLAPDQLAALYNEWIDQYPIVSIEDPFSEDDWESWKKFTRKLGDKIQIIGDDLFVTNVKRLSRGIKEKAANAILIKPNQIGTLTETLDCMKMAKDAGFGTIVSHRSGETCDTFIADLAYGTNAFQIKTGSLSRSERISKYNRLMTIEKEISRS